MRAKAHRRLTDNVASQPPRASRGPEKTCPHEQNFPLELLFCDRVPIFECKIGLLWRLQDK